MTTEELQLLDRARKALSEVKSTGHDLKALNFVLKTLDSVVEGSIRTGEETQSVH